MPDNTSLPGILATNCQEDVTPGARWSRPDEGKCVQTSLGREAIASLECEFPFPSIVFFFFFFPQTNTLHC